MVVEELKPRRQHKMPDKAKRRFHAMQVNALASVLEQMLRAGYIRSLSDPQSDAGSSLTRKESAHAALAHDEVRKAAKRLRVIGKRMMG